MVRLHAGIVQPKYEHEFLKEIPLNPVRAYPRPSALAASDVYGLPEPEQSHLNGG